MVGGADCNAVDEPLGPVGAGDCVALSKDSFCAIELDADGVPSDV